MFVDLERDSLNEWKRLHALDGGLNDGKLGALGGEGGIRTPDTVTRMPHFECGAFNHSATSPTQ